jgi:hypothetical protein
MRRTIAIVVAIVVGASCIPWLRHQVLFSVVVAVTMIILIALMAFGTGRAIFTRSTQKLGKLESPGSRWSLPSLRTTLAMGSLFLLTLLIAPHFVATNTDIYKLAVATAHESPRFTEALGGPVREGWFSEGKIEWGNQARAEMLIPEHGRNRQGDLRALAIKDGGKWRLQELILELSPPNDRIDLLPH